MSCPPAHERSMFTTRTLKDELTCIRQPWRPADPTSCTSKPQFRLPEKHTSNGSGENQALT
eukprot:783257-Amphidinium_carterae.2